MDETEESEEGRVEDTDSADHPQRHAVLEPLDRNVEISLRNEFWKKVLGKGFRMRLGGSTVDARGFESFGVGESVDCHNGLFR